MDYVTDKFNTKYNWYLPNNGYNERTVEVRVSPIIDVMASSRYGFVCVYQDYIIEQSMLDSDGWQIQLFDLGTPNRYTDLS